MSDPLEPLVVAEIECLDGEGPEGLDLWRKRVPDDEIMRALESLALPENWIAFLRELVNTKALPINAESLKRAGFRKVKGSAGRGLRADGYQIWVEGWGESCLLNGLWEGEGGSDAGDPPGSGEGRLEAYIREQSDRKRLLPPSSDPDARPEGARRWVLSLWLPAAENIENHEVVSVDLWEE